MISRKALVPEIDVRPRHVAIVMDGNRRWAQARGLSSAEGHRAGAVALRATIAAATDLGLECLTVYALSHEHGRRDASEVETLLGLVAEFARAETDALVRANVRVRVLGRLAGLPLETRSAVDALVGATAACDGLALNLALNYGARTELGDAIKALALDVRAGKLALAGIDDDSVAAYLYTAGLPDPDLLIRTGGELRVSNFLLYQIAYAELWSTPAVWPDFDAGLLRSALAEFASRQRRFGR